MAARWVQGVALNPYARLGVAPGSSLADVKRAYRRLAMHFHPDHAGPGSLQTFLAVKAAYEWIVAHRTRDELGLVAGGPGRRSHGPSGTRHPRRPTCARFCRPERLARRPLVLGRDPRPLSLAFITEVNRILVGVRRASKPATGCEAADLS